MTPLEPLREGSASTRKPTTLAAFAKAQHSRAYDRHADGVSGVLQPLVLPTEQESWGASGANATLRPLGSSDAHGEGSVGNMLHKKTEVQVKLRPAALLQLTPLSSGSTERKLNGELSPDLKMQSEDNKQQGHEVENAKQKMVEFPRAEEKSQIPDEMIARDGESDKKCDPDDMGEFVYMESSDDEESSSPVQSKELDDVDDLYEIHTDGCTRRDDPRELRRAEERIYVPHAPKEELFHAIVSEDVSLLSRTLSLMDPSSALEVHDKDSRTMYHYAALSQSPGIQAVVYGYIHCYHLQQSDAETENLQRKQHQLTGWRRSGDGVHKYSTWVAPGLKKLQASIREKTRSDYVAAMERLDRNSRSIFHYSAINRHCSILTSSEIFGTIVSAGRHVVQQRDAFGRTALEYAIMMDNPENVKSFFEVLKIGQLLTTTDTAQLTAFARSRPIQQLLYELLEASDQEKIRRLEENNISSADICESAGLSIQFASLVQRTSGLQVSADNIPRSRLRSSIHKGTVYGSIESVTMLIDEGADVNSRDANGWTPLHHCGAASLSSHLEIARILLEHRADVNATSVRGRTPLHLCALNTARQQDDVTSSRRVIAIASLLRDYRARLEVKDEDGLTPFLLAVKSCNIDLARYLLSVGADPLALDKSGGCCMHIAAARGNEDMLSFLSRWDIEYPIWRYLCDHQGRLPHALARSDNTKASINHLWSVVRLGEIEMVKFHLVTWKREGHIKVSECIPLGPNDTTFRVERTALHLVVEGYIDVQSSGQCSQAELKKFVQIASMLLEGGAAVSKKDKWGITPLMLAASVDTPMFAQAMLRYAKAEDLVVSDSTNNTALHYSYAFRRAEISSILEDAIEDANVYSHGGRAPLEVTGLGTRIFPEGYRHFLQQRDRKQTRK